MLLCKKCMLYAHANIWSWKLSTGFVLLAKVCPWSKWSSLSWKKQCCQTTLDCYWTVLSDPWSRLIKTFGVMILFWKTVATVSACCMWLCYWLIKSLCKPNLRLSTFWKLSSVRFIALDWPEICKTKTQTLGILKTVKSWDSYTRHFSTWW